MLYISAVSLFAPLLDAALGEPTGEPRTTPYVGLVLGPLGPASRALQIENGLTSLDPGAEVLGVDPGSPAAEARILKGDILMYAGGEPILSQQDLGEVLLKLGDTESVRILISRDGERWEMELTVADLPPGYLGFGVVPLCERDSIRESLPEDLASLDSLPVASWVHHDMPKFEGAKFDNGSVIVALNDREIRSVDELENQAGSVHIGEVVSLRFFSEAKYRNVRFAAQAPPKPWSGLRLEEISPMLIEAESLSLPDGEAGGLFVRKVEPESPAEFAGINPRDHLLSLGDAAVHSIDTFEGYYAELTAGDSAQIVVRREEGALDTLFLVRSSGIDHIRKIPRRPARFFPQGLMPLSIGDAVDVDWLPVMPIPGWTKVTGPAWAGFGELRLAENYPEVGALCAYNYATDWERWVFSAILYNGTGWLPTVFYMNGFQTTYREQISNPFEAGITSLVLGEDLLNYVGEESLRLRWQFTSRYRPAHQALADLHFARHEAIAAVSRPSWISGRQDFSPNPVEDIAEGRIHMGRLRYLYSNSDWRNWTRTLADAEVLVAGGPLGGEYQFVRCEMDAVRSIRLGRRLFFDGRLRAGLGTGNLPFQYEFYAGGKGTLPGREDRAFSGDRTLLVQTRMSYVPIVNPEKSSQLRLYVGIDAGNAWYAGEGPRIPDLHYDGSIGVGYFWQSDFFLLPFGFSLAGSTPLDSDRGKWRLQFNLLGMALREIAL
jgi:S1-C subfamily serine protease